MTVKGLRGSICKEILKTNLKSQKWRMDKETAEIIDKRNVSAKTKVLEGLS